tara:strand:+ start:1843 stop:3306 length:1464 start_codon:yes stop_codon:yes gene_type:complete
MIANTSLIFDKSKNGCIGYKVSNSTVPEIDIKKFIPKNSIRKNDLKLPQVTEFQVVRHYTNLSVKNHHVDKDFYPLGSCTMKYNPKINDAIAMFSGFSLIHPNQIDSTVQGALEIYYNLEKILLELTGMEGITLQPSAGSQGEMVGLLLMKKYHEEKNNKKKYVIIPETAHGTNPASVIITGYNVRQVKSDSRGRIDVDHLEELIDDEVAGLMLTQPNTLGLFEDNIEKISKMIHDVDGLMYMDGANLNALVGIAKPKSMGFDIMHINLHKTFSTPHGGGGPGSGPVAVHSKLIKYLPAGVIKKKVDSYYIDNNDNDTIGKVHTFYGNFGILVRAYVYILSLGSKGLKNIALYAVLNANYLKYLLSKNYDIPFSEGTLHEFVISAVKQKEKGIRALDIGKSLLDYGYHAPTVYFPTNIRESIMIEPTETEDKKTLEEFADAMINIDFKIDSSLDYLLNSPHKTPVRRLNEVKANRELDINYNEIQNK